MKKSKLFRTLTLAVAAALCMATTTVTAYAGGADPDPVPLPETTEAPAEGSEEAPADSTESPSFSMPTQEQVEQAASSLHQAASTVLDALFGSGTGGDASSASTPAA